MNRHSHTRGILLLFLALAACTDGGELLSPAGETDDRVVREMSVGSDTAMLWDWQTIGPATGTPEPCDPATVIDPTQCPNFDELCLVENPHPNCPDTGSGVTLDCTPTVDWMGEARCVLTPGGTQVTGWRFHGTDVTVNGPTSGTEWVGPMITSGTVIVEYMINNNPTTESAP